MQHFKNENHVDVNPTAAPVNAGERLQASLASADIGFWDWDLESGKIWRSPKHDDLLGIPHNAESAAKKFNTLLPLVHPSDRGIVQQALAETLQNGTAFRCEFRVNLRSGKTRWLNSSGHLSYDKDGCVTHLSGVSVDISEHKEIEARLQNALADAEAATIAKNQFLANMSHEIRTPLGVIIGFADFILDPSQTKAENRESAKTIRRNGEQLLVLIDELLDISKVETHLQIEESRTSLPDILKDVSSLMTFKAREKGLSLEFEKVNPLPYFVKTDPTRLRQILLNVIGNAIKFTEKGGVKVSTQILLPPAKATEPAKLKFQIEDTGIGLTQEQAAGLFQPFMQADGSSTRRFGGTGLGLALAKRLAVGMGGDLSLTDTLPGHGSLFTVEIACGLMSEIAFEEKLPADSALPPALKSPLRGIRVLLVDDARDNQILLSHVLKRAGAQVLTANSGQEGLDRAISGNFDVVLMDIQMPGGLDGYEATSRLRARGYKKPIIALTAHARSVDRERSFQVGCNDHLTKPVDKNTLVEAIEHFTASDDSKAATVH